jgi:hypothetical protein
MAWPRPALATPDKSPPPRALSPTQLVGPAARPPDPEFARALDQAYADPSLSRTRQVTHWELRQPRNSSPREMQERPAWLDAIGTVFALLGEYGLWILAGLLLAFLLWRLPRWLPWFQARLQREEALPETVESVLPEDAPLPDDVPAAASALWQEGRRRDALALLYRASVLRLADRLGTPFPPGATEAECLRRARRLEDAEARASFAEVVRTWQRAAYAQQFPDASLFDALLASWAQRFPVSA